MANQEQKALDELKEKHSKLSESEKLDLKAKNLGAVLCFEMEDEEGNPVVGYFKKPSRQQLMAVISLSTKDAAKGSEVLFNACFLKEVSNPLILEDDACYLAALGQTGSLIEMKEVTLKKI